MLPWRLLIIQGTAGRAAEPWPQTPAAAGCLRKPTQGSSARRVAVNVLFPVASQGSDKVGELQVHTWPCHVHQRVAGRRRDCKQERG